MTRRRAVMRTTFFTTLNALCHNLCPAYKLSKLRITRTYFPRHARMPYTACMSAPAIVEIVENLPLSSKHRHIALLDLDGLTNAQIAARVDDSEIRIGIVRTSPLYQAYRADLQQRLEAKRVESVDELIQSQVRSSIETLIAIRDNHTGKVPPSVQARAAESLLGKVMPAAQNPDQAAVVNQGVILTEAAAVRLANILVEAGVKIAEKKPMQNITDLDDAIDVSEPSMERVNALLSER